MKAPKTLIWLSAATLLSATFYSLLFINKAEANHCGLFDFTGSCLHPSSGSEVQPIFVPQSPARLTEKLYREILGREPDPSGFNHHVNLIKQNGFESVRAGIASGQESRNNINNLYKRYLCRNADPGGMDHHINLLASGQMTLDQIRSGIAIGAEAQQHKNGCR